MELQWPINLFTTLLAWAAGVFGAQCLYALRGQGTRAQMPALIASAALLVVGGIAVFFHLEHWERIFNGFGHLTSGITQELIAIIVLFVAMVVYFVYLRRGGDDAKVPTWLAAVGLVLAVVLVAVMGHSYMMASLPAWDSVLQIGSLLGAACGFGPATMALICAVRDEASDLAAKASLIGQAVDDVGEKVAAARIHLHRGLDAADGAHGRIEAVAQGAQAGGLLRLGFLGRLPGGGAAGAAGDVLGAAAATGFLTAAQKVGGEGSAGLQVQGAPALGAADLVGREGSRIHAELLHIERHLAQGLHGIGVEEGAALVGQRRQLADGLDGAHLGIRRLH